MSRHENKKLDDLIRKALGRKEAKFDFEKWRAEHGEDIRRFEAGSRGEIADGRNIMTVIFQSKWARLAAAAVLIGLCIVGMSLFLGDREDGGEGIVQKDGTSGTIQGAPTGKVTLNGAANGDKAVAALDPDSMEELIARKDFKSLAKLLAGADDEAKAAFLKYVSGLSEAEMLLILSEMGAAFEEVTGENPLADSIEQFMEIAGPNESVKHIAPSEEKAEEPKEEEGFMNFQVRDKETGLGLAGVKLLYSWGKKGQVEVFTDKTGKCRLELNKKKPRYVHIKAAKDGFMPMELTFYRGQNVSKIPFSYTLSLEKGMQIGGTVRNEGGEPIEGASVSCSVQMQGYSGMPVERYSSNGQSVVTDANGQWRYGGLKPDAERISISFKHDDYVDSSSSSALLEDLTAFRLVQVLKKGVDVTGSVVDEDGKPIAGAQIFMGEYFSNNNPNAKTDDEGQFEIRQITGGRTVFTVKAKGYAPVLEVTGVNNEMEPLEFELEEGYVIRGQVIDANDNPLSKVYIRSQKWHGYETLGLNLRTDEEGYFELEDVPGDDVYFDLSKSGYEYIREKPMSAELRNYIIVMESTKKPSLTVRGQVMDAETREPIKKFNLVRGMVGNPEEGDIHWEYYNPRPMTDGSYKYEISGGVSNGFALRVEADGYAPADSDILYPQDSNNGQLRYSFRLKKGSLRSGTVYMPDGSPAAAEIYICTRNSYLHIRNGRVDNDPRYGNIQTQSNGDYYLPEQTEMFTLAAFNDAGYAEVTEIQYAKDPNIYLTAWGQIEGDIYIGSRPGAGENINVSYNNPYVSDAPRIDHRSEGIADANGHFVIKRILPGSVKVSHKVQLASNSYSYSNPQSLEVLSGETGYVLIGGKGRPVTGRIVLTLGYKGDVALSGISGTISGEVKAPAVEEEQPQVQEHAQVHQTSHQRRATMTTPEGFSSWSHSEQMAWYKNWLKTAEGIAYRKENSMPDFPDEFFDMTPEQQREWQKQWSQTEEAKALEETQNERRVEMENRSRRMQGRPPIPDNYYEMTHDQRQKWERTWLESAEGKVYMEAVRKEKLEREKCQRSYSFKVAKDGAFLVEDVEAGNYSMSVNIRESNRAYGNYSSSETIGSVRYSFEVPEMEDGFSDEPLDIGAHELTIKNRLFTGDMFPEIELEDIEGNKKMLSEFRGKVVFVMFWFHIQTHDTTHKDFMLLKSRFSKQEDFQMLYISLYQNGESLKQSAGQYEGLENMIYGMSHETRRQLSDGYSIAQIQGYLIGRQGKVISRNEPVWELKETIEKALADQR